MAFKVSARTSSSYSVRQLLFVGRNFHVDIFDMLIHSRLFRFSFLIADTKKMFLQVNVAEEDRCYQRFVWPANPDGVLDVYDMNEVVFGHTSSPSLPDRVVRLLAELKPVKYLQAAIVAKRDAHVMTSLLRQIHNRISIATTFLKS